MKELSSFNEIDLEKLIDNSDKGDDTLLELLSDFELEKNDELPTLDFSIDDEISSSDFNIFDENNDQKP